MLKCFAHLSTESKPIFFQQINVGGFGRKVIVKTIWKVWTHLCLLHYWAFRWFILKRIRSGNLRSQVFLVKMQMKSLFRCLCGSFWNMTLNCDKAGACVSLTSSRQLLLHNVSLNSLTIVFLKRIFFSTGDSDHFLIISTLPRTYCSPFAKLYTGLPPNHYLIYATIYFIWSFWSYPYRMLRTFHLLHFATTAAVAAYSTITLTISPAKLTAELSYTLSIHAKTLEPWQPSLQIPYS